MIFFLMTLSYSQAPNYIALIPYDTCDKATKARGVIAQTPLIQELRRRFHFELTTQRVGDNFYPALSDFNNSQTIALLYNLLERDYPKIVTNYRPVKEPKCTDTVWFFMILIMILVVISTIIIDYFYKKYRYFKEQYEKTKQNKNILSAKHDELLQNLGYKIERSTTDMIHARDKIINEPFKELSVESVRHKFKAIQDTDKILTDTTNQIIDFLKAKSGKLKLVNRSFDINRLLESITMFVAQNYKGLSVELVYEVNLNVPHYMIGDFRRLNEILINIVDYSYRHTSTGYVKLIVSTFEQESDKFLIEFKIIDNSTGVHKAQQERLFVPFQDPHSKRGLFVSKEFTTLMGGRLDFVSRYGRGNIFSVTIPLEVDHKHEQNYRLSSKRLSQEELKDKYMGVIDKDENVAHAIQKSFLHISKNVNTIAHYSLDDYDVINRFDLIFVEHSMLTRTMLDLFNQIQKERELHVVAMHNILSNEYKEIVDQAIDRYVAKPISPSNALKIFLDTYKQPKVIESEEEIIFMEKMEDHFKSTLPKQHFQPLPETSDATKSFLKDFSGSSLLIVDDNEIHHKHLQDMMRGSGIKYALATTTQSAIEQLNKYYNHFDLILINLELEKERGLISAKMIRSNESYSKIPLIAIVNDEYAPDEIIQVGINAYFIKPLKVTNLYTALNQFLEKVDFSSPFARLTQSEHILDITRGIMQAQHDERIYLELVQEFQDAYGESGELLKSLIEQHDYTKIKELVINMKGLSNILGANDMYRLINELESLLQHQRYNKLSNYVSRYIEELEHLSISIEIYIRSVHNSNEE
jgi:CheY-like chemotaxis protein/HPt (histidine-containing phosphotransfer) domain-containing protein